MTEHTGPTPRPKDPRNPAETPAESEADAPLGGDTNTEDQLTADNAVEEDSLRTLDPDDSPA